MENLKVSDDEYSQLAGKLATVSLSADEQINTYLEILGNVVSGATVLGVVATNLGLFNDCAQALYGCIGTICTEYQNEINEYLQAINTADEMLF